MKLNKKEFLDNCTYEVEHKENIDVITDNEWYKRSANFGQIIIKLVHEDLDTDIKSEVCKLVLTKIPSSFCEYEKYLDYSMAQKMEFLDKKGLGEVARVLGLFDDGKISLFEEKYNSDYQNMFYRLEQGNLYVVTAIECSEIYRGNKFAEVMIEDLPDLITNITGDEMPTIAVLSCPYYYKGEDKKTLDAWHKRLYKFYSNCKNDLIEITPFVFYYSEYAHVYNDKRLVSE